ncbi:MAG: glycosyltransferase family 39 protein [Lachnospiraceae bacterium]|nr:glycosyltransferase family 39 protein [Lachnospiraceae bacterium]
MKMKPNREKIVKILTYFYLIPLGLMVCFNTVNSLLRTTYFDLYRDMETALYKWDNPALVLAGGVVCLVLLFCLWKKEKVNQIRLNGLSVWFGGILSLVIVLLFRCEVVCDSEIVSDIALEFMKGNYAAFSQGEYLYRYPFQLGITALLELIYSIFGAENFITFQIINVVCIMVILKKLQLITGELFEDEKIKRMEAAISMGCLPLFLFATFIYGDMIGWCLGICAIYFVIRYLKNDSMKYAGTASLFLCFGVIAKSNINILVVAAVIAILLHGFKNKKRMTIPVVLMLILVSQLGNSVVNGIYAKRAGIDEIPAGIPKAAWIAMSMQETDEGGYACGWYNGYNWVVYEENDFDRELTTQACIDSIKESLSKFAREQRYMLDFFYKKFTSQWNAPSFQAMITNEWYSRYSEPLSETANFFIYGSGRNILYELMNIYHFFLFLGTAVFCFLRRKKWDFLQAYFILNIFGGFLFHMIWEAQSRYILGYFVLMLPLAACGVHELFVRLDGLKKKG